MEDLFDVPNPMASEPPIVPLGKRVFNPAEYHLKVANAVVSALSLPHQIREHDRNTIAAHFNKRKPDASDVSLPAEMPIDKYSAHINQSGDALLNTLIGDAQRWCQQRTYDGSKLSNEVLKSNLVLMLRKRLDSMFENAPVFSSKQRQLVENVFGVQASPKPSIAQRTNEFSSSAQRPVDLSSSVQRTNEFASPAQRSTSFAPSGFTASPHSGNFEAKPPAFSSSFSVPPTSSLNPHGPTCDCGYCEQSKKKKKSKAHKKDKKPETEWRRNVYKTPNTPMKAITKPTEAVDGALSIDVVDPATGKNIAIALTPIAAQPSSIFDTNTTVDVAGKWRPEYFGRITPHKTMSEQFLEYAETQIQNSNVNVIFMPSEAKLAEVKANADKRGAPMPFDGLWSRHAAVHVNTTNDTHQARSLAETIGNVYHDGKTLSVPKLGHHYVKILESKQQQIAGKTVTVHIHEGLFIQQ